MRVVARSRPVAQLVENNDGPNGLEDPRKPVRCGIEPARRRESEPELLPPAAVAVVALGSMPDTPEGRKGLVDGVVLVVWDMKGCCWRFTSLSVPTGENLDGTVPARARRAGLFMPALVVGTRSGKPS